MPLTRKEYCYMYFSWIFAIIVLIWYIHNLMLLPDQNQKWFEREKGDL